MTNRGIPMRNFNLPVLKRGLVLVMTYVWIVSCERPETEDYSGGKGYYPVETGRYQVYEVTEEVYGGTPLQSKYWIKEQITSTFTDGPDYLKLVRSVRYTKDAPWKADSLWALRVLPDKIIRLENNTPLVKLIFPVRTGTIWDMNELNRQDPEEMKYVSAVIEAGEMRLSVHKLKDSSALGMNRLRETYALGKGMICREKRVLEYCQDPHCIGQGIIVSGRKTLWQLIETGLE